MGEGRRKILNFKGFQIEGQSFFSPGTGPVRKQLDRDQGAQGKGDFWKRRQTEIRFGKGTRTGFL